MPRLKPDKNLALAVKQEAKAKNKVKAARALVKAAEANKELKRQIVLGGIILKQIREHPRDPSVRNIISLLSVWCTYAEMQLLFGMSPQEFLEKCSNLSTEPIEPIEPG